MPLPIVGMHFRPPAKALVATLRPGTPLVARREPDNEFDPNAIRVLVTSEVIMAQPDPSGEFSAAIESALSEFGFSLRDIAAQAEWHLGYIPATIAASLAPRLELDKDYEGKFTLSPSSKPMIDIEFPQAESSDDS